MKEFETLKKYVQGRQRYALEQSKPENGRIFFYQAFGAVDLFCEMHPEMDEEVGGQWWNNNIREEFMEIVNLKEDY